MPRPTRLQSRRCGLNRLARQRIFPSMAPPSPLVLVYGTRRWTLDRRPITIGRLPECDVVLSGDEVSRRHATIIPTPNGPMLVDQSRHGVTINAERMQGPVETAWDRKSRSGSVLRWHTG